MYLIKNQTGQLLAFKWYNYLMMKIMIFSMKIKILFSLIQNNIFSNKRQIQESKTF